jgi:hypothetical protein
MNDQNDKWVEKDMSPSPDKARAMETRVIKAECPHCSFRFADPDEPLREGDELACPECRGIFSVLSLHPPEFHWVNPCNPLAGLFMHALIAKGMSGVTCWSEDIANLAERARKQGLPGVTFRVSFEEPQRDQFTVEILSVD